ncbi:MAG: YggS family pyridoxal phosphate-dependent enzyme [Acidiferrobacterales bacterium]
MTHADTVFDIAANLRAIRDAVADASAASGRAPEEIRLVAISKNQPPEHIAEAVAAGQQAFGENTAQEALTKIERFRAAGLEWHFIGHVQSNKARHIPGNFAWLHSLDSLALAQRLARSAASQHARLNTLIEVNITRDPAKHGIAPENLAKFIAQLLQCALPGIELRGLMAIGPHDAAEAELRTAFAAVRALRDECRQRFALPEFSEISMGMSGDFVPAIREGATIIRVGTAIFGARDYSRR